MARIHEKDVITPPPFFYVDERGSGGSGGRDRVTLICSGCGDATRVNKVLYTSYTVLTDGPPPVCSRCGVVFSVLH